ncbi:VCBS repeat-containing protein [Salmonirosea aquatica]|uniref:RNA-binding protein n=1 Tax=Salmonirosea aquatica TaxID=2654236 RepID=A0A7C9FDD1_9BACT|nr:RNA-binding protein [Cytophagaceae bacterium SJW1-29]
MLNVHVKFLVTVLTACLVGCRNEPATLFKKIDADDSGVHFINKITPNDSLNAFTLTNFYNGGGVGVGDFNHDSLPDLFFAANQVSSRLYINEGNRSGESFTFRDVTEAAGVTTNRWCTGVSVVDINQDGWDDIYISVAKTPVSDLSRNLLFINQKTKTPTFKEEAESYGLAFEGFTTQTAFFDYDLDGDLDAFLLNTAPDLQNPNNLRPAINNGTYPSTDRLFENVGKNAAGQITFHDVSQRLGIRYEGLGLGVVVSDFNDDGYPDVYCSNDFISSDILYLNNQDGTFSNVISTATAHTSLYGMGVDAADLTNDGKTDILQMDMLPEDNFRQKQMLAGQDYDRKEMSISPRYQYQMQYMRNNLQLNVGNDPATGVPEFSEMGLLAGIARTDWSWATLLVDLDNDGRKDVFITNGYRKNITDRDFITYAEEYSFFGSDEARMKKRDEMLNKVPEIKLRNYAYRNVADYAFKNVSAAWGLDESSYANGAAWADLDRDGDLDLIVNNIDSEASIFQNRSNENPDQHYLTFKPLGPATNPSGLGVKVTIWVKGQPQKVENYVVRGYASSVEPVLHFGLGQGTLVDSVLIQWPGGSAEKLYRLRSDQTVLINYQKARPYSQADTQERPIFTHVAPPGIDYQHQESDFVDFKQTATLHKMLSRSGFPIVVGDVNGDGLDDFFVGGSYRGSASRLYVQKPGGDFRGVPFPDSTDHETTGATFLDADGDGDQDLFVVYGGNERPLTSEGAYQPTLFLNDGKGKFTKVPPASIPKMAVSASSVVAFDYDQDGDQDLFVAGRQVPGRYPLPARSYLLRNDSKGTFTDVSAQAGRAVFEPGLVCDVLTANLNGDAYPDLVMVGEWMPIRMFVNDKGRGFLPYATAQLAQTEGWWNCLAAADLDGDGDTDFIVGNEGLNTFYSASPTRPISLVGKDFNGDGTFDPVMGYYLGEKLYPAPPRDALNQQIIQFRKKYQSYGLYAKATYQDLFSDDELKGAFRAEAFTLQSTLLVNEGNGKFIVKALPRLAQQAPVFGIVPFDFNHDGHMDVVLSGNFFPNEVHMGRQDASRGLLLLGDGRGNFKAASAAQSGLNLTGDARTSRLLHTPKGLLLLTAINSQGVKVNRLVSDEDVPVGVP